MFKKLLNDIENFNYYNFRSMNISVMKEVNLHKQRNKQTLTPSGLMSVKHIELVLKLAKKFEANF